MAKKRIQPIIQASIHPTKPFGRTCKVKDVGSMPDSPQKDQGKKRAKTTLLMTFATLTKQTWANEGNTRPAPRMVHRTALRTCISSIKSRTQRQRGTDTAGGRPDTNSEKVKLHTNLWSTKKMLQPFGLEASQHLSPACRLDSWTGPKTGAGAPLDDSNHNLFGAPPGLSLAKESPNHFDGCKYANDETVGLESRGCHDPLASMKKPELAR